MLSYTKTVHSSDLHLLLREVSAINRCQSYSGIVQLLSVKYKEDDYRITTKLAGRELGDNIMNYTQSQILNYTIQILQAVAYCHSVNIHHRDIKPNNIVLQDDKITLIDFDMARHDIDDCIKEQLIITGNISSPYYSNPECLSGNTTFYRKGDEWSIGIVLYNMLAHKQLVDGYKPLDEIEVKLRKGLKLEQYTTSKVLIQVCEGLLTLDPAQRLSCEDALNILGVEVPKGAYTSNNDILPYPHDCIIGGYYRILKDWLTEFKTALNINSATLSNALTLVQIYTSYNITPRDEYQLLGCVCIYVSSLLFDIYPPDIEDLVYITGNTYTTEQFMELMNKVLAYFKYDVDRM